DGDFFCIIHVALWKKTEDKMTQEADKANWYIYNSGKAKEWPGVWTEEDFSNNKRVYGVKRLWLLFIHLGKDQTNDYEANYTFDAEQKQPTNVANAFGVATLFPGLEATGREVGKQDNVWGGGYVDLAFKTSEITVKAEAYQSATNTIGLGDSMK